MGEPTAEEKLDPTDADGLYPDRSCIHRNMGPPAMFPCCVGRGYYDTEDGRQAFCSCAAGRKRREVES